VVLDDSDVSRRHARLEIVDNDLVLTDLGSTNGTYVNDALVTRRVLVAGDRMRIGRYELTWTLVDPQATVAVNAAPLTAVRQVARPRVAARRVVEAAEARNRRVGHELDGFLSLAHGFCPPSRRCWPSLNRTEPGTT
jgi:sulfite reductase (NADPH) flavoprotein alpha-component